MTEAEPSANPGLQLLSGIIADLHRSAATGILSVRAGEATRELVFVQGEVRAACSSLESEKLGSWLVDHGVIDEEHKQVTLSTQGGSESPPLGHLLVQQRLTTEEVLEVQLQQLALTIIERAVREPQLGTEFREGLKEGQPDTLPNLTTPQTILFAARREPDLPSLRMSLDSVHLPVRCTTTIDRVVEEFDLTMSEKVVVGKLHRERTVEQLRQLSQLKEGNFYPALYAMMLAGIVSPASGSSAEPDVRVNRSGPAVVAAGPSMAANVTAERNEILRLAREAPSGDHYRALGLPRDASYQQIFDAWEEYRSRFHPRRASEQHFQDIRDQIVSVYNAAEEAFEVLSSPERRPRYDHGIRAQEQTPAPGLNAPMTIESMVIDYSKRSDSSLRAGDVLTAIRLLEKACDLDQQPPLMLKLARLMLRNPKWANRALEKLRRALEIDPKFVDGWLEVADFWRRRKSRERERKALERAVAAKPTHPHAVARYRELVGEEELRQLLARVQSRGRRRG